MKLGIISLGGTSSELIGEKAKEYFKEVDLLDIRKIEIHANSKEIKGIYEKKPLKDYDCVYIRGSYNYALVQRSLSYALESKAYLPIKPDSFNIGHDKFLTLLSLQKNKVRIPKTYLAASMKAAKKILEEINYPIIMKVLSGTQGKGVMSADSLSSARTMIDALESLKQPVILQEYIETNSTDIRAIVAGNEVIASMKRKGRGGDIRANIHQGGIGVNYELDHGMKNLAIKSAKAVGAELCGVDILDDEQGGVVIEVNLSPGLQGITRATKKDVAKDVAEFLFKKTLEFKNLEKKEEHKEVAKGVKAKSEKELLTNLEIRNGKIRLPELLTKISGFDNEEEVVLTCENGRIEIKRVEIK